MQHKKWRNTVSLILAAVLLISMCQNARAAGEPGPGGRSENTVVFSEISGLSEGESMQKTILDAENHAATIGIRKVTGPRRDSGQTRTASSGETWQVWYSGLTIYAEFYMTVSNNRVTSVYDERIDVFGGSYSNSKLTSTSTYGKLSFSVTGIIGITTTSCWLKGAVTGADDKIDVTWQM